jgi:hypothetical protein
MPTTTTPPPSDPDKVPPTTGKPADPHELVQLPQTQVPRWAMDAIRSIADDEDRPINRQLARIVRKAIVDLGFSPPA